MYSQEDQEVRQLRCLPLHQQDPDKDTGSVSSDFNIFIEE